MHEGHRERLRKEYLQNGGDGLPDHRFLELLLCYAIPRKDTNELAHRLIQRFGSLEAVLFADTSQLQGVDGIGEGAAVFLNMQGSMARRLALQRLQNPHGRTQLVTPLDATKLGLARLGMRAYENVELVCLNAKRYIEHIVPMHTGVVAESQIYPRQVVETALLRRAHSVLLYHNHPSGNPSPSADDKEVTDAVRAALGSVDIPLLDHIIVGRDCAYSFSSDVILALDGDQGVSLSTEEYATHIAAQKNARARSVVMEAY